MVAPSGFKESLEADEVARCIERGVLRALPEAQVVRLPLVDGGEGFTRALVEATGGSIHQVTVTGPTGHPVASHFGVLGDGGSRTAVIEMAAAAGLRLVPRNARDPLLTTTWGVGELLTAALDTGAERILVGCGDSGTSDGGAGMAQALGVRLLDHTGAELSPGGLELSRLDRIDLTGRDPRLGDVSIDVACNWHNLLCGPHGVARVFGPQKGASPHAVERLAAALEHYADVIERDIGVDVRTTPGSGASGGLGAGLQALLGATLHPRFEIVMRYLNLDDQLRGADLAITAEGTLDHHSPKGKVPAEVARQAKAYGVPVIALAGTIGPAARINLDHGIAAYMSILCAPCTLDDAINQTAELLTDAAEQALRLIKVGQDIATKT